MTKGGRAAFTFPEDHNTALLVLEGNITVNRQDHLNTDHFVLFRNDGDTFTIEAREEAVVLIISGEPIDEPIAAHGPFVMNTRAELKEAFDEFNRGVFGNPDERCRAGYLQAGRRKRCGV